MHAFHSSQGAPTLLTTHLPKSASVCLRSKSVLQSSPYEESLLGSLSLRLQPPSSADARKSGRRRRKLACTHLGEPRAPFHLLGVANVQSARRLPLLKGARFAARRPGAGSRLQAARRRLPPLPAGDSLVSFFPWLHFGVFFLCSAAPLAGFSDWKAGNLILPWT